MDPFTLFTALILLLVGVMCVIVVAYRLKPVTVLRGTLSYQPAGSLEGTIHTIGLAAPGLVRADRLPGYISLLLLLHEDDLFFVHRGVNVREVLVRVRAFVLGRDKLRGGSSLSQQLVKNTLSPPPSQTPFIRCFQKGREFLFAVKLERNFSKHEILTLYLNSVRFGPRPVFGIGEAARFYFGKEAEALLLHEALFLFGLLPRPLAILEDILIKKICSNFPYNTAFTKCTDLLRLFATTWGWGTLSQLSTVSYHDISRAMIDHLGYIPRSLPDNFELGLQTRALLVVEQLEALVLELSKAGNARVMWGQSTALHGQG